MRRELLGNSDPAFVYIYVDYSFWEHLGNILTDGVNLKGRLHCFLLYSELPHQLLLGDHHHLQVGGLGEGADKVLVLLYERIGAFLPYGNYLTVRSAIRLLHNAPWPSSF